MARIIVATEFPYSGAGGGPAVIRQMLQGFPGEIYWWSVFGDDNAASGSSLVIKKSYTPFAPGRLYPYRKLAQAKAWCLENFWVPLAASHLSKTIEAVQPDCVWVIPHNWSIPVLHRTLLGRSGSAGNKETAHVRWHTTIQDYVGIHDQPQRWGRARCWRFAEMADELYALAATRDATSLPMLDDLAARTGARGVQMLHQGLEAEDFAALNTKINKGSTADLSAPIRIAYAGTILVEPEFRLFVDALREAKERINRPVILEFFSAHSYSSRDWFKPDWMVEHGHLDHQALLSQLRTMDWGFIPMAIYDTDPRYNRFSFPTKFITYLAAGLPIITLAHRQCSVVNVAQSYGVGLCITAPEKSEIKEKLLSNLTKSNVTQYVGQIALCAVEYFNITKMREILSLCLLEGRHVIDKT